LAQRKHELDTGRFGWFYSLCVWNNSYLSAILLHRIFKIYSAYGGIFIVMALLWGWLFLGARPDKFDIIGACISLIGVAIIFYMPRKNEAMWKEGK
jgi:drug/metabolite transporter superfamily protein YnfA